MAATPLNRTIAYLQKVAGDYSGDTKMSNADFEKLENLLTHIDGYAVRLQRSSTNTKGSTDQHNGETISAVLEDFVNSIDEGYESQNSSSAGLESLPSGENAKPSKHAFSNKQVTTQIFFDCDNTLVDTEAAAIGACSKVVNKCLADHGVTKRYTTEELLIEYFGLTARKMISLLAPVHNYTLTSSEAAEYARYEEDLVINLIHANPSPCPGVEEVLQHLTNEGRYKLTVVSSSPIRRIRAALEAVGIAKYFDEDQVFSAKNSMPTSISKPDPAIYNFAMAHNNVQPWQCVAFEDSRSGARSAINAGIPCIGYLGTYNTIAQQEQVGVTLRDEGCKEVMLSWTQAIVCLERAERRASLDRAMALDKWDALDERWKLLRELLGQVLSKQ